MKKQLFDEIIAFMLDKKMFTLHPTKRTETDEIITYCFEVTTTQMREDMVKAKEIFTRLGYKQSIELGKEMSKLYPHKDYYTVLYNKVKDKISLSKFMVGYAYGAKKDRWYPYKKSYPILCYSKHIYQFNSRKKPRILLSTIPFDAGAFTDVVTKVILKIDYESFIMIPYKNFLNTTNEWEAMEKYFKVQISDKLRTMHSQTLFMLFKRFNIGEIKLQITINTD